LSETARFRDFTKKREPLFFTIGEQRFNCYSSLSPKRLQQAIGTFRETKAAMSDGVDEQNADEAVERVLNVMAFFIKPKSFVRFRDLVMREPDDEEDEEGDGAGDDDVDIRQLLEIVQWLVEQQGMRPTQPSSDSSITSAIGDGGTSSMDGAPHVELTH